MFSSIANRTQDQQPNSNNNRDTKRERERERQFIYCIGMMVVYRSRGGEPAPPPWPNRGKRCPFHGHLVGHASPTVGWPRMYILIDVTVINSRSRLSTHPSLTNAITPNNSNVISTQCPRSGGLFVAQMRRRWAKAGSF